LYSARPQRKLARSGSWFRRRRTMPIVGLIAVVLGTFLLSGIKSRTHSSESVSQSSSASTSKHVVPVS